MEILVFKTNLRYRKNINAIEPHISGQPGIIKWNVDLKDADKILRVVSSDCHPQKIEGIIKSAGYRCEELKD
jgi:hypothetical protein